MQLLPEKLFYGPVESRLEVGRTLFLKKGEQLRQNSAIMVELALLQQYAATVNGHMAHMDLGSLCTRCSTLPSGGCCSLAMAGETDAIQISMNLLAGVDVRIVRRDGRDCSFLGASGCIFLFKPIFCLNYLCKHIHDSASPASLAELHRLTGRLLGQQYEVEQLILAHIRCGGQLESYRQKA